MRKPSEIVLALADIASRGKYEVTPVGAKLMNEVFEEAAQLINTLEAQERESVNETPEGNNNDN